MTDQNTFDAIVVGAGFAGLQMLHLLRQQGKRVVLVEAAPDVGGTWYWNRYPGLRCDIESLQYCYTFAPSIDRAWRWTERFPRQKEIQQYLSFVTDHLDLRRDIRFETRVISAVWQETHQNWVLTTDGGETLHARYCVMATGLLATPILPEIPGVASFAGQTIHSARWPENLDDFSGKRIGLIGTGSSGIQLVPELAKTAKSLHVFIRSAPYAQESHNIPLTDEHVARIQARYPELRERARHNASGVWFERFSHAIPFFSLSPDERRAEMFRCWGEGGNSILNLFNDVMTNRAANDEIAEFMRERIAEIVTDPETARKLTPTTIFGAKRLPIGTGYHAAFNRDNVVAVALREEAIETIHPGGIRTAAQDYPLDMLVLATGYDAGTGALANIDIIGRDGAVLKQQWAETGPQTCLGILAAGFPNMFIMTAPGSPGVLTNVVMIIEQHCEWTADCIAWLDAHACGVIDAVPERQQAWMKIVHNIGAQTLFTAEDNWYTGANVPGKPKGMMFYAGGLGTYRKIMQDEANSGYATFDLSSRAG